MILAILIPESSIEQFLIKCREKVMVGLVRGRNSFKKTMAFPNLPQMRRKKIARRRKVLFPESGKITGIFVISDKNKE